MARYRELVGRGPFRKFLFAGIFALAAPGTVLVVLVYTLSGAYPAGAGNLLAFRALALSFLGLVATIPTLLAALFSGTLADRSNRRRLMALTGVIGALGTAALAAVYYVHDATPVPFPGPTGFYLPRWVIEMFAPWAAIVTASSVFRPAFNAALPLLTTTAELGAANSLVLAGASIGSVIGTLAVGGLLISQPPAFALLVPIALFVGSMVSVLALSQTLAAPPGKVRRGFLSETKEGYRFLARRAALLEITLAALVINFLSALAFVELGLYVRDWLGSGDPLVLSAMFTSATAGAAVGIVLIGRIHFERRAGVSMAVFTVLTGASIVVLSVVHNVYAAIADMFVFGLFPGMFGIIFLATVQATVPNEVLGRVFAADELGSYAMVPVGQYAGGLAVVALGSIGSAYLVSGLGIVAVGAAMAALGPVRSLGFEPRPEPGSDVPVVAEATSQGSA